MKTGLHFMLCVEQLLMRFFLFILYLVSGTGKTLSLLCATLGWLSKQKEIKRAWTSQLLDDSDHDDDNVEKKGEEGVGADKENAIQNNKNGAHFDLSGLEAEMADDTIPMEKIPKVIYASRTHSQLTQGKLGFVK